MRRWKEPDGAVSPVLATLMLVAIAAVLAVTVYAFAARPQGEAPGSLALTQASSTSPTDRSFNVAAASPGLRWGDIQPILAGTPLVYDGNLASDGTWCRESPDGVCLTGAQHDPDSEIRAGQRLRVHDSAPQGKTLQIRDPGANALLATFALR